MMDVSERLRKARLDAKFLTATDAARAFGWGVSAYISHENGQRGLKPAIAEKYARAYKVPVDWLLYGKTAKKAPPQPGIRSVPLIGYVAAGARTHFFDDIQSEIHPEMASTPAGASEDTVAVEVRGESLGPALDRWLVFYDDVRRPVTPDLFGQLCVVGLPDGRIMVKVLHRSKSRAGLFHLMSNGNEAPILDAEVDWAAPVIGMSPRK